MRSEIELILCCARTELDKANIERIQKIIQKKDLDWQIVIQNAYRHGLMPLLYKNLNYIGRDTIPEDIIDSLKNLFLNNTQRNFVLTGEMLKLLKALEANGIVAVPYKGPVLANLLYGDVGLRQFCDLDIMVLPQDVLYFKKLLIAEGYKPKIELTAAEETAYLKDKSKHTYNFIHHEKRIMVEVHWRITPQYTSSIEAQHLWQNLQQASFGGMKINTLAAEDWLPILCVHASRHRWEKLSWLSDIAELIKRNPTMDWDKMIGITWQFDARRMLFLGLLLTHHLIGINLPKELVKRIKSDAVATTLASEIGSELLSCGDVYRKFMQNTLYHLQVKERWENKLLYLELFMRWLMRDKNVLLDE